MIESILNNIKQTIKEVLSDMGVTEEVEILKEYYSSVEDLATKINSL